MYKYKKGWVVKNGNSFFNYAIGNEKLELYQSGKSLTVYETENVTDYIEFCKKDNANRIVLVDIGQEEFNLIIEELSEKIEYLSIWYSPLKEKIDHCFLEKCKNLKRIEIKCYKGSFRLWELKENPILEYLEITGIDKLVNQELLKGASVSELVIRNRDYSLGDTKVPIINDFSVFETMANLKILDLFVGKKKEKKDDLISLAHLSNVEKITLPKNYFTFSQYAWLNSKLTNVKGIGCIKEERWNKLIEKNEYTINGTRMAWEFKDYWGNGIDKYVNKFNNLVKLYKNEDIPPEK